MDHRPSLARPAAPSRGRARVRTAATIAAGFLAGAIGAAVFPALIERRRANLAAAEPSTHLANVADPVERARQAMNEARLRALEAAAARESRVAASTGAGATPRAADGTGATAAV